MKNSRYSGFTLTELLVSLAILGLLATMAAPVAKSALQRKKEGELKIALREIRLGIDRYKEAVDQKQISVGNDDTGYPPNLSVLVNGVSDQKNPGKVLYFLRKIPRDPFYTGTEQLAEKTWGLRSYASSSVKPQRGNDVYDIYSTSNLTGLNGVPYKDW